MTDLNGKTIAFLCTNGVEQVELTGPWQAITEAGGRAVLVSLKPGTITAMNGDWEHGDTFDVDAVAAQSSANQYDALVMPGGTLNADNVRLDEGARSLVRGFFEAGKPVASICHGPWTLIDAQVAKGRTMTSYVSIKTDLVNAGANWVDDEVVVDNGLITSRNPGDLDAFNAAIVKEFAGSTPN